MTADTSLVLDRDHAPSTPPATESGGGPLPTSGLSARSAVIAVASLIAVAVAVALFIGQGSRSPDAAPAAGAARPARAAIPFTLPDLRGGASDIVLPERPTQPTVVNFFAAWCEPCKRELPALAAAAAANPGVTFLGVDYKDSQEDAVEMLASYGITYPAGYDPRGDVAARYAIRGLPATVFIDTDGRIVDLHQGELNARELDDRLRRLTAATSAGL